MLGPGRHIDTGVVRRAGRATYERLLGGGVRVFEYQPTLLDATCVIVDGVWSSVGSANFDNRSFQLNDEAVLTAQDRSLAGHLTEAFEHDLAESRDITPDEWSSRPLHERAREAAARLLRREL